MVYESVDLTEKSSRESATGNVMFGIPSNPKRDFDWQKIKTSKLDFCLRLFANMPQFFHHHQIDVAQRDGVRILLSMINADSYILHLAIDYAQNYAHILQVLHIPSWSLIALISFRPVISFPPLFSF